MQTMADLFNGDAFTSVTLTDLVNQNYPYIPGWLTALGIAPGEGITTLDVAFSAIAGQIKMIQTSPRGAPPSQMPHDRGTLTKLSAVHMARQVEVYADELLGIAARGQLNETTLQGLITRRIDGPVGLKQQLGQTMEHMLLGLIDGVVYDADNSTVLYDYFGWTGAARPANVVINFSGMSANTALLQAFSTTLRRASINQLNGLSTGAGVPIALCGDNFYDALTQCAEVVAARKLGVTGLGTNAAIAALTQNYVYDSISIANINWVNYRGSPDSAVAVPTNEARFFYSGIPGLFQRYYAPADTFETVSAEGLPYYLLNDPSQQTDKRAIFELQSNPLLACLRPLSLQRIGKS